MATEPKRIGLFGMFGTGNIGNDGSLESMVRFLRRVAPEERLLCICGNPAAVEKAFGLEAVPIYHRPPRLSERRAAAFLQRAAGRATLWWHAVRHLQAAQGADRAGDGRIRRFLRQSARSRMAARHPELVSSGPPDGRQGHPRQHRRGTDPSSGQPVVAEGGRPSRPLPVLSRYDLEGVHGEHRVRRAQRSDLSGHRVPAAGTAIDPPA